MKQHKRSVVLILRGWQEDTAVSNVEPNWRFRVETPAIEAAQYFRSTEELLAYLGQLFDSKEKDKS